MKRASNPLLLVPLWMLCQLGHGSDAKDAGTPRGIAPPRRIPAVVTEAQPRGAAVSAASIPKAVRRALVVDAARRFEVAESAVVLTQAEQVTWSDDSLGCPEPGHKYAQALVPGYRVTAATTAGHLRYHTDLQGNLAICARPAPDGGDR